MDVLEKPLRDGLDVLALLVGQCGIGLGQEVEDREFFLIEIFCRRAHLLFGEVAREGDQPTEVLVDVDAAGVVRSDQLLNTLDQVNPCRVTPCCRDRSVTKERCQALCFRTLAAGEASCECVEVDLAKVNERVRINPFRGGPDDVLLRTNGSIEKRVNCVGNRADVWSIATTEIENPLRENSNHSYRRLLRGRNGVWQHRLEKLACLPREGKELFAHLVINEEGFYRGVSERYELESRS